MNTPYSLWYIDGERPMKRRPRMEIIGKTFILVDSEWRSEPYYFGDLVHKAHEGETDVYGLEDDLVARPKWRLGIKGDVPQKLKNLLPPPPRKLALSGTAMLIIAFLCLGIVYFAVT